MNHAPIARMEYEILGEEKKLITMPSFKADVEIKIKDQNGNVKFERTQPFRSFVGNFTHVLNHCFFNQSIAAKLKDVDNASGTATTFKMDVKESAPTYASDNSLYGIWIGNVTNNSGISNLTQNSDMGSDIAYADYNLNTFIDNYNTADAADTKIAYGATSVTFGSDSVLTISRTFTNNNTTAIKISEIGLVAKTNNTEYLLIARDTIDDGSNDYVSVAASYIIDINYKFSVTSSSGFTKNFVRLLSSHFNGGDTVESIVNSIGGAGTIDVTTGRAEQDMMASTSEDNYGLLVGGYTSLAGAVNPSLSNNAYKLASKLDDSDLTHGAVSALNTSDITISGDYTIIGCQRDFTNPSSTDTVYVFEAGLFMHNDTASLNYMISRLLTGSSGLTYVAVQPGKILRLKYYLAFPISTKDTSR